METDADPGSGVQHCPVSTDQKNFGVISVTFTQVVCYLFPPHLL